jgi:Fur family ferric uptake transcriptional regulator
VLHLECKCSDEVAEHLLGTHGFTVDRGRSVLYGICAACGKREG